MPVSIGIIVLFSSAMLVFAGSLIAKWLELRKRITFEQGVRALGFMLWGYAFIFVAVVIIMFLYYRYHPEARSNGSADTPNPFYNPTPLSE